VEPDALDAANANRGEAEVVLQPAELALDRAASPVQVAKPRRAPRDERAAAIGLQPHRGRGFYGYKLHAAVCAVTGLPVVWQAESARHGDALFAVALLDSALARGFKPETCAMDKGYDSGAIHDGFEDRGVHPIVAQIKQAKAKSHDDVPTCEHGQWVSAGTDFKRKLTKWRCPNAAAASKGQLALGGTVRYEVPREGRRGLVLPLDRKEVETNAASGTLPM